MAFLGIDTSNYTTSVAILCDDNRLKQEKLALPVADMSVGLRQSDAVFAHIKQLAPLLSSLLSENNEKLEAVGVSVTPRDEVGSYMPCFLAGKMCAESIAATVKVPCCAFSHQAGHIAAAIFDTDLFALFDEEFLAFHVSGGTTQCLLVTPEGNGGKPFNITTIAQSLDLHAGQVIDRVGAMLGLKFPSGAALEILACESTKTFPVKVAFKELDCCLSGVENQCKKLLHDGENPADIARFCIDSICYAVSEMTARVTSKYPNKRLLYAGGVMSNALIRKQITARFDAAFATPAFSADNAAGIAVLCKKAHRKGWVCA